MDDLIRTFSDYYIREDFRKFQNNFVQEVYNTLGVSYSNSDGEVKMVTDMCCKINGKEFEKLQFHAMKIHGSRSFVEFNNQDKPTTKELADMVIISVATKNKKIIYEKTALIQNKKEDSENSWKIDQDQLYLLHNFPTFKGNKGIFRNNFHHEVIFQNSSKSLGNYGFFKAPGEMILVDALTVYKLQNGDKISFSDIRKYAQNNNINTGSICQLFACPFADEIFYKSLKYIHRYGLSYLNLPFLNNYNTSFNIYEFIRNWSLFNIGEIVSIDGYVNDSNLMKFNQILFQKTGLFELVHDSFKAENLNREKVEFDNNMTIMIAHLNLDDE